jgi:hypothetical protein
LAVPEVTDLSGESQGKRVANHQPRFMDVLHRQSMAVKTVWTPVQAVA